MVQPKRFLREPLEGELVPSLQEGELVLSLQEGKDVLMPAVPVHHASPVKADEQDEETSRYYNVFLCEPLRSGTEEEEIPLLQEEEIPSLQEEETLSLQEGEDVLVPEGFDHFSAWLSLGVNQESS